jgi:hypothetical protein
MTECMVISGVAYVTSPASLHGKIAQGPVCQVGGLDYTV